MQSTLQIILRSSHNNDDSSGIQIFSHLEFPSHSHLETQDPQVSCVLPNFKTHSPKSLSNDLISEVLHALILSQSGPHTADSLHSVYSSSQHLRAELLKRIDHASLTLTLQHDGNNMGAEESTLAAFKAFPKLATIRRLDLDCYDVPFAEVAKRLAEFLFDPDVLPRLVPVQRLHLTLVSGFFSPLDHQTHPFFP